MFINELEKQVRAFEHHKCPAPLERSWDKWSLWSLALSEHQDREQTSLLVFRDVLLADDGQRCSGVHKAGHSCSHLAGWCQWCRGPQEVSARQVLIQRQLYSLCYSVVLSNLAWETFPEGWESFSYAVPPALLRWTGWTGCPLATFNELALSFCQKTSVCWIVPTPTSFCRSWGSELCSFLFSSWHFSCWLSLTLSSAPVLKRWHGGCGRLQDKRPWGAERGGQRWESCRRWGQMGGRVCVRLKAPGSVVQAVPASPLWSPLLCSNTRLSGEQLCFSRFPWRKHNGWFSNGIWLIQREVRTSSGGAHVCSGQAGGVLQSLMFGRTRRVWS